MRWQGPELEALRQAYECRGVKVDDLAARFGTNRGHVGRLANRHGWKRRRISRLPEAAHRQWNLYRKVQAIAGHAAALEAVAPDERVVPSLAHGLACSPPPALAAVVKRNEDSGERTNAT